MLANQRKARETNSKSAHGSRRYSAKSSQRSTGSRYKEKAQQYYTSFGGKHQPQEHVHAEYSEPMTPQSKGDNNFLKKVTNFYLKNKNVDEPTIKMKSLNYLDQKGILKDKINQRYYRDNDLAKHLKVDRKQCLCHQMRIGDQQLRVRYPKTIKSLYTEEYEKKRKHCVGGKTQMFNRDKEKKFFKADPISMKTTKQMDFTGEQVPYERVKKNRPATSYGPFISSTSYGHTFQGWDASGSYVPVLKPKGNLQSTSNMPFKAVSAYRDTFRGNGDGRPGTSAARAGSAQPGAHGEVGGPGGAGGVNDPNKVFGGKNRAQKSQISILGSPGDNKAPFMKDTTHRTQFQGQRSLERSRPIKHMDNLGNVDLKIEPNLYNTSYRNNYNDFGNSGMCNREAERVTVRKELKQLQ